MRRFYGQDPFLVMPADLLRFAWSAPLRDLAPKVDMTDVGLKKFLVTNGIVCPPQGYWNKKAAGKRVPKAPSARQRHPGETGRITVNQLFGAYVARAAAIPSTGPFASEHVPEDLAQLFQLQLQTVGRIGVPKSLDAPHKALKSILAKDERRKAKFETRPDWAWEQPEHDNPLAKRRLRLINALFLALEKRGYRCTANDHRGGIETGVTIGHTHLRLSLDTDGPTRTIRRYGYERPAPDLPLNTPLKFEVDHVRLPDISTVWRDGEEGQLETRLPEIVAGIVTAGEAAFRANLKWQEEWVETQRREQDKWRRERLEELNHERVEHLHKSGKLLRQAENLRELARRVRSAMEAAHEVTPKELSEWEAWALAEADRLDPISSGQFLTHLRPPTIDDEEDWP